MNRVLETSLGSLCSFLAICILVFCFYITVFIRSQPNSSLRGLTAALIFWVAALVPFVLPVGSGLARSHPFPTLPLIITAVFITMFWYGLGATGKTLASAVPI